MLLKIIEKKEKPFTGDSGEEISYFWYKAVREGDGITIKFGSMRDDHVLGDIEEVELEKSERIRKGKSGTSKIEFVYKEVFK